MNVKEILLQHRLTKIKIDLLLMIKTQSKMVPLSKIKKKPTSSQTLHHKIKKKIHKKV